MHVTAGMVETLDYRRSPLPVRDELVAAHRRAWTRLPAPGEWWTGAVRVAISTETRTATDCALCKDRRAALSPYAVTGTHHTAATDLREVGRHPGRPWPRGHETTSGRTSPGARILEGRT